MGRVGDVVVGLGVKEFGRRLGPCDRRPLRIEAEVVEEAIPKDRRVFVYCRSGYRGHLAVRILKERGFRDVLNVTGGYLNMVAAGGFERDGS